jgi:hypothetical protein
MPAAPVAQAAAAQPATEAAPNKPLVIFTSHWAKEQDQMLIEVIHDTGVLESQTGAQQMKAKEVKWAPVVEEMNRRKKSLVQRMEKEQANAIKEWEAKCADLKKSGRQRMPKGPEPFKMKENFVFAAVEAKFKALSKEYTRVKILTGVTLYQQRGESGSGGENSLDSKLARANARLGPFQCFPRQLSEAAAAERSACPRFWSLICRCALVNSM